MKIHRERETERPCLLYTIISSSGVVNKRVDFPLYEFKDYFVSMLLCYYVTAYTCMSHYYMHVCVCVCVCVHRPPPWDALVGHSRLKSGPGTRSMSLEKTDYSSASFH